MSNSDTLPHAPLSNQASLSSGLLLIDKPKGVTSHDIVAAVRSRLNIRRVGHAGTLDPMATGLLIVGFGHATRLLDYIVAHTKTYQASIRFGQSTTTDDAEGSVLQATPTLLAPSHQQPFENGVVIDRSLLETTIHERFVGEISQVPSTYSAIKVKGRRAYDLARHGEHVDLKARAVTVSEFSVIELKQGEVNNVPAVDADVCVRCSAGTYIRALARDLGAAIGTGAHLTALRRTTIGDFSVDDPLVIHAWIDQPTDFEGTGRRQETTDGHGESTRRSRVKIQLPDPQTLAAHAMPLFDAVQSAMPTLAVEPQEIVDLRFGRKLMRDISSESAAYDPATHEVIALIRPDGKSGAQPFAVFPADDA